MTLSQACNVLHIEEGTNDDLVNSLIAAAKDYIMIATDAILFPETDPLVDTVIGYLLTLWYYSDHADDQALNRTISSLLSAITMKYREYGDTGLV